MKKRLRDARTRWFILAVLWVVVIVLGIGGFIQQAHEGGITRPFLDTLYLTLQLATLDYDGSTGPMNWRLQVCRFVVPLMAASTVLQTASVVFSQEFAKWRISRASGHTVVCGLGDTGGRLALAFEATGDRVVAIDTDPSIVTTAQLREDGLEVLAGDATDADVLRAARVDRASRVVVTTGDDARNVQVASAVAAVLADGSRNKALRVQVQLEDAELATMLRATDLDAGGDLRLSYFNLHERAARALLAEHPPFAGATDEEPPRPLVIGLGRFGRSLVVALAQQWAELHPGRPLALKLVDQAASGQWAALANRHPALEVIAQPEVIDLDLSMPSADGIEAVMALLDEERPTWVAIVVDDEALALANAVFLHQRLPQGEVPIVVRMGSDDGLGGLLSAGREGGPAFPGLEVFPFLDRACTVEGVEGGLREQLAQAVHEDYLRQADASGAPASGLRRSWAELDDDQRDLSRRRVDGIVADLDAIGCDLAPLRRWGAPAIVLTDAEEDTLAAREHQRWFDDRSAAGWTHGPERDDARKHNPLLVAWDDLPLDAQVANVEAIRALVPTLARAGFEPVRR